MSTFVLYLVLLRATLTSFSGLGSVPLVREDLVTTRAALTDQQLNDAIAISQASPGPLGLYVVIVGYFVAGVPGAIAGVAALATPAVLAVPILSAVRRGRANEIRGACSGIVIVSCVLMIATSRQLAPAALPSIGFVVLAIAGFLVLALTRVPPLFVILGAACIGLFL